jgi:hypothetical protein
MNSSVETGAITPPRLFPSLKAGFDAVASHISLILFPIALDALLWLGQHLSIKAWLVPILDSYFKFSSVTGSAELKEFLSTSQSSLLAFTESFNLVSFLRTYPLGIPSLISGIQPVESPLGLAPVINFNSSVASFGAMLLFMLIGILLGAQYFYLVERVANHETDRVSFKVLLSMVWQVLSFTLVFYLVGALVSLPLLMITSVLIMISPDIGIFVMITLMFIAAWISLPLIFSTHGIFTFRQPYKMSLANSIRLGRYAGPQIATFAVVILVLTAGLNQLWSIPKADDWLLLVGIAGHAFISTALLAGSFIYYRSAMRWVQEIIQHRLAAQKPAG